MSDPALEEDEKPLDPAAERVRRKMVRLMAVSISTMLLGIFAVLFAIVYKLGLAQDDMPAAAQIMVPPGFEIRSASRDGSTIVIHGADGEGSEQILQFDAETGNLTGKVQIKRQANP